MKLTPLLKKNRKGAAQEVFIMIIIFFSIAVIFGLVRNLWIDVKPELQGKFGTQADNIIEKGENVFPVLDIVFIFIVIGYAIFVMILASRLDIHPVFYIFAIILLAIAIIVTVSISNAFGEISSSTQLSSAFSDFPAASFIMNNLVLFITVIGFLVIIVMYVKFRSRGMTGE